MDVDNTVTVVAGQDGKTSTDVRSKHYRPSNETTPLGATARRDSPRRERDRVRSPSPRVRYRRFRDEASEERAREDEEREKRRKRIAAEDDERELLREEGKLKKRGLWGIALRQEIMEVNEGIVKRRLQRDRERLDRLTRERNDWP